jgi:hypothetical protein
VRTAQRTVPVFFLTRHNPNKPKKNIDN